MVYVSPSVREAALEQGVCVAEKAVSILSINGLDADRWRPSADREEGSRIRNSLGIPAEASVLGFVGRLLVLKGIPELLEAWGTLKRRYPNLYLVLVGEVDAREPLPSTLVDHIKNDPRIRSTGFVRDVRPFYCALTWSSCRRITRDCRIHCWKPPRWNGQSLGLGSPAT